jgi:hypothetical protein
MAKLIDIRWADVEWPESEVAGYGKQKNTTFRALIEKANQRGVKPSVIYVSKDMDEKTLAKRESMMFGADDVAIGTQFFHCFRLAAKDVPDAELKAQFAKTAPVLLFLDTEANVVAELAGTFDSRGVLKSLDKTYGTHYAGKLTSQVDKFLDWVKRYEKAEDKVADVTKRVEDIEGRMAKSPSDTLKKSLEEERTKLGDASRELAKLDEERAKLLAVTPKDAPKEVVKEGGL